MKEWCVYCHTFPNGKKYVGISCDPQKRWREGKGYQSQRKMANAIKKYGWENVEHEIIVDGVGKEQALALERKFVEAYDSLENGYNATIGGDTVTGTYLNAHILEMIRESDKYDEIYGEKRIEDDIVSLADKARYNLKMARVFNEGDRLIDTKFNEYKTYHGQAAFYDLGQIRVDCYWWTMAQILAGNYEILEKQRPYWQTRIMLLNVTY